MDEKDKKCEPQLKEKETQKQTVPLEPPLEKGNTAEDFRKTDPVFLQTKKQLEELQEKETKRSAESDLKAIRKAYPDELAQNTDELGSEYKALRGAGISPLLAYEALRAERARNGANVPPMGDISQSYGAEKSFFSKAEVDAMTPAQIKKNYDVIRKSMDSWTN